MGKYRLRYDHGLYQILRDYCENTRIVIESDTTGLVSSFANFRMVAYPPIDYVLIGDIHEIDCGSRDQAIQAIIYPEGETHLSRSSVLGGTYIETGIAYIEWEK